MKKTLILLVILLAVVIVVIVARGKEKGPVAGEVQDEAMAAGYTAADFPGSESDYLKDMDKGLTPEQVHANLVDAGLTKFSVDEAWRRYNRGRINWAVWTGGNDRFWDVLGTEAFGALDLLKTVSSHPNITYERDFWGPGGRRPAPP